MQLPLVKPYPARHVRHLPSVALQVVQELLQLRHAPVPPVEYFIAGQVEHEPPLNPDPGWHEVQTPVVALQAEHWLQTKQVVPVI
jgi:hypothetical protein